MSTLHNKKVFRLILSKKNFAQILKRFANFGAKIEAYEANSPLQKRFCDFSQRGYVFGFYIK